MKIVLAGDTHGTLDIGKVVRFFYEHEGYTREDYLIILGDVAVCGFSPYDESNVREILEKLPVTVLFIDGNHENFDKLYSYDVDIWNGGKVHYITGNIIHLMRGQVFDIGGIKIFTFGGAYSIDKDSRTPGVSWFPEEIPSEEEYEEGLASLVKHNFSVDYILSHTAPSEVAAYMGYGELSDGEVQLRKYLQRIADAAEFKAWYFGHFHEDTEVEDTFFCLFDEMVELNAYTDSCGYDA